MLQKSQLPSGGKSLTTLRCITRVRQLAWLAGQAASRRGFVPPQPPREAKFPFASFLFSLRKIAHPANVAARHFCAPACQGLQSSRHFVFRPYIFVRRSFYAKMSDSNPPTTPPKG